ncbi:MAG: hypothetical protein OXG79_12325 [Chloroflexi bacterium]|nr:hypothetical protein [Chloroflexota bacterium]
MAAIDGSTVVGVDGLTPPERAGPTPAADLLESEANALIEAFERASLSLSKSSRDHSRASAADRESAQAELNQRRAAYDEARQGLHDALTGAADQPERVCWGLIPCNRPGAGWWTRCGRRVARSRCRAEIEVDDRRRITCAECRAGEEARGWDCGAPSDELAEVSA